MGYEFFSSTKKMAGQCVKKLYEQGLQSQPKRIFFLKVIAIVINTKQCIFKPFATNHDVVKIDCAITCYIWVKTINKDLYPKVRTTQLCGDACVEDESTNLDIHIKR